MDTLEMIILTASRKYHGKCVAGIDAHTGGWIRLTTTDKDMHFALTEKNLQYQDGTLAQILDVVRVPVKGTFTDLIPPEDIGPGEAIQTENILIDETRPMEFLRKADLGEVLRLHPEENKERYIMGNEREWISPNNRHILTRGHSLILVEVNDLRLWINEHGNIKADFNYPHPGYAAVFINKYANLPVTDPDYDQIKEEITFKKAYLVISMGTPIDRTWKDGSVHTSYYKFVSKIFPA